MLFTQGCFETGAGGTALATLGRMVASNRPAGPGIKISNILLSIISIDYYSQKKITFIITA